MFPLGPLVELPVVAREPEVVKIEAGRRCQGRRAIHAPEALGVIGLVVERAAIEFHGPGGERVDAEIAGRPAGAKPVEAAADVGAFAHRDEALRAEGDLLTPRPQRRRAAREVGGEVGEALLQVEVVLVGRGEPAVLAELQVVADLNKSAEGPAEAEVGVQQQPVQEVVVLTRAVQPEIRVVEELVTLPKIAAERKVGVAVGGERQVLDRIPNVRPARRIA